MTDDTLAWQISGSSVHSVSMLRSISQDWVKVSMYSGDNISYNSTHFMIKNKNWQRSIFILVVRTHESIFFFPLPHKFPRFNETALVLGIYVRAKQNERENCNETPSYNSHNVQD